MGERFQDFLILMKSENCISYQSAGGKDPLSAFQQITYRSANRNTFLNLFFQQLQLLWSLRISACIQAYTCIQIHQEAHCYGVGRVDSTLWQYWLWSFQRRDTKLEINCSQMKLLNYENWRSGELSKIGHHFRKQSDFKIDIIKKATKNVLLTSYSSMKKKSERFR